MAQKNQLTTADPLSFGEFTRLLDCLHADKLYKWEAYAVLSFCTACRFSDVSRLRWSQILYKNVLTVTEKKTGKTRKIAIGPSVKERIRRLYRLCKPGDLEDYIVSGPTGDQISSQYVNRRLKEFKEKYNLDIDNFSTHTFRKTFGRYVYDRATDKTKALVELNQILMHSNIATTRRYIGITSEEIGSIFQSISL